MSSTRFYSSTSLLNVADDKYHGYPRVKISHYEMLSTFFSIRYIYIRWNGNFGLRARLLFPRPQRFPIPERNIFSLKKQDKRPTFEEYQPRRRSLFRIEWNVPFQFINSSNNSCINYLWTRGSFLPMNFHRGNWELCFSLPNYCWKIIIFLKLLERDWHSLHLIFFCFKHVFA